MLILSVLMITKRLIVLLTWGHTLITLINHTFAVIQNQQETHSLETSSVQSVSSLVQRYAVRL